jgi:hypothetical protein
MEFDMAEDDFEEEIHEAPAGSMVDANARANPAANPMADGDAQASPAADADPLADAGAHEPAASVQAEANANTEQCCSGSGQGNESTSHQLSEPTKEQQSAWATLPAASQQETLGLIQCPIPNRVVGHTHEDIDQLFAVLMHNLFIDRFIWADI